MAILFRGWGMRAIVSSGRSNQWLAGNFMLVIGLISGTSVDGIDAALVEISGGESDLKVQLLAGETYSYPEALREEILAVIAGKALTMAEFAALDEAIALAFAYAAQQIQKNQPKAELIGSHGQTVYHLPPSEKRSPNPQKKSSNPLEEPPPNPLEKGALENSYFAPKIYART